MLHYGKKKWTIPCKIRNQQFYNSSRPHSAVSSLDTEQLYKWIIEIIPLFMLWETIAILNYTTNKKILLVNLLQSFIV